MMYHIACYYGNQSAHMSGRLMTCHTTLNHKLIKWYTLMTYVHAIYWPQHVELLYLSVPICIQVYIGEIIGKLMTMC